MSFWELDSVSNDEKWARNPLIRHAIAALHEFERLQEEEKIKVDEFRRFMNKNCGRRLEKLVLMMYCLKDCPLRRHVYYQSRLIAKGLSHLCSEDELEKLTELINDLPDGVLDRIKGSHTASYYYISSSETLKLGHSRVKRGIASGLSLNPSKMTLAIPPKAWWRS